MKILILTVPHNAHAQAVCWGRQAALRLGPGLEPAARLGQGRSGPFDVIWLRRDGTPTPIDRCHPDDAEVVVVEAAST